MRSPATTPITTTPQQDPLNDPTISRAFSQKTKIRFLRVGLTNEDLQRTLKEILAILDKELSSSPGTRARTSSTPAPFVRSTSSNAISAADTIPYLGRRGSEASSRQMQSLVSQHTSPVLPQLVFQKARPFQLVLDKDTRQMNTSSPPQSPRSVQPTITYTGEGNNLLDPVSQEYLSARFPFAIVSLPSQKLGDPPSPAGTPPSGSRRHSRILDSEGELVDIPGEMIEGVDYLGSEDHEAFVRALENLELPDGGQTWEELIDRLINPGIPGEGTLYREICMLMIDNDFALIFLVVYRRFAAPSKLLNSLISKFEEATTHAIDSILRMIIQTRYLLPLHF